jgi:COP9 signalosome complex subunit 6
VSPYFFSQNVVSEFYLVIGALLGTQTGREVDIVNTFEMAVLDNNKIDHAFIEGRRDQCMHFNYNLVSVVHQRPDKQVFPSLEFIGWYTVTPQPTAKHVALQEQVSPLQL